MSEFIGNFLKDKIIEDCITIEEVTTCRSFNTVGEVLKILQKKHQGAIVIVSDDNKVEGIFTERDLLNYAFEENLYSQPIGRFMSETPKCVELSDKLFTSFAYMRIHHFRHLIVVDNEHHPIGICSIRDAFYFLLDEVP